MFQPNRALHSLEVAKQMYEKSLKETRDINYAQKMFHLGLVHDIGYQFTDILKNHPHAGGMFLKKDDYPYWKEVYQHGDPSIESPSAELQLLNWADMSTDGSGNRVSFSERLRDIENRYGKGSEQYNCAAKMAEKLKE